MHGMATTRHCLLMDRLDQESRGRLLDMVRIEVN